MTSILSWGIDITNKIMNLFLLKLKGIYAMLTSKHWVLVKQSPEDLYNMLEGEDFNVDMLHYRMQPYCVWKVIKEIGKRAIESSFPNEVIKRDE